MAENMFCSGMKVASEEFRNNFDRIFGKSEPDGLDGLFDGDFGAFGILNTIPRSCMKDCFTCRHGNVLPSNQPCCECLPGCESEGRFTRWEPRR